MPTTPLEFPAQIDLVQHISYYAHDLRSPFNRMMGFLKIVLKGQDGPLTDLQKEDLSTVYQNSVYAFTMVSNLIDVARLITGEKSLSLTETGIVPLFQQAITYWQKYHPDQPVQFDTHHPAELLMIQADGAQLSQAISGLIVCAVECVKPPVLVSLTAEAGSDGWIFTVRSTGQRAPNPSQMDLATYGFVSHELIALHGGKFILQESSDEGVVLQFTLPKN